MIKENIGTEIGSRARTLLESVNDCENFKFYLNCVKNLVQQPDQWQEFFESTQNQVYTSDYHIKLPLPRFDTKQAVVTYSEMVNILILARPYEIGTYLKTIPRANNYVFNSSTAHPHLLPESRLIATFPDGMFLIDWLNYRFQDDAVVHLFQPPQPEDAEKFFVESKTVLVHDMEHWSQDERNDLLKVYKSNFGSLNKSKLVVKLSHRTKKEFDYAKQFDSQVQGLHEVSVKSLCTYFLYIDSGLKFNTYTQGVPKPAELMEYLLKIDYDYSKELKSKAEISLKEIGKVAVLGKISEQEILYDIDLVHLLNRFANHKNSAHEAVDENRTQMTLYMLFSIIVKSLAEARKWRNHCAWLSCYDTVALTSSISRIICAMSENTTRGFTQCMDYVLKCESHELSPMLSQISSQKLNRLFAALFLGVYKGTSSAVHLESEFYRFSVKSIKRNYSEIFNSISAFPSNDPASLSLQTERDLYLKGKQESMSMIEAIKYISGRRFLKVSFTSSLKLLDSKDCIPNLNRIQRERAATEILSDFSKSKYSGKGGILFEEKLCLLKLMNELSDLTKTDITKLSFTNTLITLKLDEIKKLEKAKSIKNMAESPKSLIRPSIRQVAPRKSILENFRAELQRRYSTRNRDSFAHNTESRNGSIAGNPAGGSPAAGNRSISSSLGELKQQGGGSISRADSITKAAARLGSVVGKATVKPQRPIPKTEVEHIHDSLKIEMTFLPDASKRNLNIASRFLQSALWTQVLELNQLKLEVYNKVAYRIEMYSGEIASHFGENEYQVLSRMDNEIKESGSNPEFEAVLSSILSNRSPACLSRFLAISLESINFDRTFIGLWEKLRSCVEYIEQLARREDGHPETGVYELGCFMKPAVFLTNMRIHYSLKTHV